ncbi:MAG: MBL fold metallo-hydrolase [Deltaproteobacteria bacterium]|nr:MBL fold metallo-hydrolase [Deltaproteobacteria bacterium]
MLNLTTQRVAVGLVLALCTAAGCDRILDRQIEQGVNRADQSMLTKPDLQVVLCGTGSPLPDKDRAGPCTAIVAGGQVVLVDVGPGAWESLDLSGVPTGALSAVLLTHFHSDHIGDLGEAITQSWISGRTQPLDIYGPAGTTKVVDGFDQAYSFDADYRTLHHGEEYMPRAAAPAVGHDVPLGEAQDADAVVFDRNGLKVTMFRVHHDPVTPAVGYRFDYNGRSVVISGDTGKSVGVATHAKGADILIHEALNREMMGRISEVAGRVGQPRLGKMAHDTLNYHTSPVEAAELARDAGVPTLVLTHVVPGPRNAIMRSMFLDGVSDVYSGEVIVGEDGQRFSLPPKS